MEVFVSPQIFKVSIRVCSVTSNSVNYNPPVSSVHGNLQARVECAAISYSRESS